MLVFTENNPDGYELVEIKQTTPSNRKAILRTPDGRQWYVRLEHGEVHFLNEQLPAPNGSPDGLGVPRPYEHEDGRYGYGAEGRGGEIVLLTQIERDQRVYGNDTPEQALYLERIFGRRAAGAR